MAFIIAHPVAIIPIYSRWSRFLSLPALVIGSITPDLEFLLPYHSSSESTIFWLKIVEYYLPLGLLISFVFLKLLYQPTVFITPNLILNRLRVRIEIPGLFSLLLSVFIGVITHHFWDYLVLQSHLMGNIYPPISKILGKMTQIGIPFPIIIEYLGTLLGFIFITRSVKRWVKSQTIVNEHESYIHTRVFKRIFILCVVSSLMMTILKVSPLGFYQPDEIAQIWILSVGEIFLSVYLVYSLWWQIDLRVRAIAKKRK